VVGTNGPTTRDTAGGATRRAPAKPCPLCGDKVEWVDYKDVNALRAHMSDRGKIRARRVTGNCARHQREIAMAIKTARQLGLLPYAPRAITEGPARTRRTVGGVGGGGGLGTPPSSTARGTQLSELRKTADSSGGVR
jgi:small subunit ribosomal protein S18